VIVYATPADLTNFTDAQHGDETKPLLRKASVLVRRACRNDRYDAAPNGTPSDADLKTAMVEATCAQVEVWLAGGYDVIAGPGGQAPRATSIGVDGGTVSYDSYLTNEARAEAMTSLHDDALAILRDAGLASPRV
jgi:hypothetical protein